MSDLSLIAEGLSSECSYKSLYLEELDSTLDGISKERYEWLRSIATTEDIQKVNVAIGFIMAMKESGHNTGQLKTYLELIRLEVVNKAERECTKKAKEVLIKDIYNGCTEIAADLGYAVHSTLRETKIVPTQVQNSYISKVAVDAINDAIKTGEVATKRGSISIKSTIEGVEVSMYDLGDFSRTYLNVSECLAVVALLRCQLDKYKEEFNCEELV